MRSSRLLAFTMSLHMLVTSVRIEAAVFHENLRRSPPTPTLHPRAIFWSRSSRSRSTSSRVKVRASSRPRMPSTCRRMRLRSAASECTRPSRSFSHRLAYSSTVSTTCSETAPASRKCADVRRAHAFAPSTFSRAMRGSSAAHGREPSGMVTRACSCMAPVFTLRRPLDAPRRRATTCSSSSWPLHHLGHCLGSSVEKSENRGPLRDAATGRLRTSMRGASALHSLCLAFARLVTGCAPTGLALLGSDAEVRLEGGRRDAPVAPEPARTRELGVLAESRTTRAETLRRWAASAGVSISKLPMVSASSGTALRCDGAVCWRRFGLRRGVHCAAVLLAREHLLPHLFALGIRAADEHVLDSSSRAPEGPPPAYRGRADCPARNPGPIALASRRERDARAPLSHPASRSPPRQSNPRCAQSGRASASRLAASRSRPRGPWREGSPRAARSSFSFSSA